MTPDERTLLTRFLNDLVAARGVSKDQEADAMVHQALGSNPDAAYLLVQHAIMADQSLHAAQARIVELEDQVRSAAPAQPQSTFLPQSQPQWRDDRQSYNPVPQNYESIPMQERPGIFSSNSGLGSFLRNAGTTAAGVAGGEMLFSGLSDLFGGHRGGGFGSGQSSMDRPEEVVVNNYDDDSLGDLADGDRNGW